MAKQFSWVPYQIMGPELCVTMAMCIGGSYSDVVAEVSNRDTLCGEEVESSELLNEQSKRKRVYPSASVSVF